MDPRLAKASADFQAQLRGAGANLNQVLGGIAVLAYGIAAITTIATKCGPGNTKIKDTNVEVSSIFGKGSSSKADGGKGSSSKADGGKGSSSEGSSKGKDENNGSSDSEGKNGSSQGSGATDGAEAEAPAEGSSEEGNAAQ